MRIGKSAAYAAGTPVSRHSSSCASTWNTYGWNSVHKKDLINNHIFNKILIKYTQPLKTSTQHTTLKKRTKDAALEERLERREELALEHVDGGHVARTRRADSTADRLAKNSFLVDWFEVITTLVAMSPRRDSG